MQEKSLTLVINKLEELFEYFNKSIFNNGLEIPIISVYPIKRLEGWCTTEKVWKSADDTEYKKLMYEISISTEYLSRPFDEICCGLIHQMVHLLNLQNEIQDTSRNGTYHNAKFKETAERHGLITVKTKNGYAHTTLSEKLFQEVMKLNKDGFTIYREIIEKVDDTEDEEEKPTKVKRQTFIYLCPTCKSELKSKQVIEVKCNKCNIDFEIINNNKIEEA